MDGLWNSDAGYASPNPSLYPWQWLWDSCFHAIIWSELGDERATLELETLLALQRGDGMVPHMGYQLDPGASLELWGIAGSSTITQPPMFGHAIAVLAERGYDVERLVGAATAALRFLLERRRADSGAVLIAHPWESGLDDSPRWDPEPTRFDRSSWGVRKVALVRSLALSPFASAIANPAFSIAAASFNAMVAFNCRELARVSGDAGLLDEADQIAEALESSWDDEFETWADRWPDGTLVSRRRTLDALLPVLVTRDRTRAETVLASVANGAFAATYGPRGVHPCDPAYDPSGYWRGAAWPPLTYLLWVAATRLGLPLAGSMAATARAAALRSGFAEYFNPETGAGLGGRPQGWACLPLVMGDRESRHDASAEPDGRAAPER
jgi:hypothetical protein